MLQFKATTADRIPQACFILPVRAATLPAIAAQFEPGVTATLQSAIAAGDLPARCGSALLVRTGPQPHERVVLVSAGDASELSERAFADMSRAALRLATAVGATRVASCLHEVPVRGHTVDWKIEQSVLAARDLDYRFDGFRSRPADADPAAAVAAGTTPRKGARGAARKRAGASASVAAKRLARVDVVVDPGAERRATDVVQAAVALADAIDFCRDLANTPPNVCTPRWLAEQARDMARRHKLSYEALDADAMKALGMGALLAVAQGSAEPPRLVCVRYRGAGAKDAPVVLVGKGVTFDTGGISIKPAADMDEMKFDMCGAATVLAVVQAAAAMKLPLNVVAVVPAVENMPSGTATRPGDIVRTMSGQTVEILNTDAEGRLILCDALTWAQQQFKPAALIDVATLTGAIIIALGGQHAGLFSPDDALADRLLAAGREAADTCWRMPVEESYQEALRSTFADMGNVGGRAAGSTTAACFLSRFVGDVPWAHLDIAGVAWKGGTAKAANGRPVGLLVQYLRGLSA